MSGIQCHKKLWFEIYRPDLKRPLSVADRRILDSGTQVGELARLEFANGKLVTAPYWDFELAVSQTNRLQSNPAVPHVYEAALQYDTVHVKVDVLSRVNERTWDLIEVKSSSKLKPEHLTDIAIQWHVAGAAGLTIRNAKLMHLRKSCTYPDLSSLFEIEDVTESAGRILSEIPPIIRELGRVVHQESEPDVKIGSHCTRPYECPFKDHCWREVPQNSIFTIPRLKATTQDSLVERGILSAAQAPAEMLNGAQNEYVSMVRSGAPVINREGIREMFSLLEFPLYFLDFETCADAVPRFTGLAPWSIYPFQFSLHVLTADCELRHSEYLHTSDSDPRPAVAAGLAAGVGDTGSIVAYNASYEKRVISGLAELDPDSLSAQLSALLTRFFDLLDIFRLHYSHPGFRGSNSIKSVLPVLVPELGYDGLTVQNGDDAQAVWSDAIRHDGESDQTTFGFERESVFAELRRYCELDTMAMVRIYQELVKLL